MRLQQNPLFRKEIAPWYDSDTSCLIMMGFLLIVFLFSITGISEAYEKFEYHKHVWVPGILAILSGGIIISTSTRLIKRYYKRQAKEKDDSWKPARSEIFEKCSISFKFKEGENLSADASLRVTGGIHWVFWGLKFEPDTKIGRKGAFCKGLDLRLIN